jgi:hypothetical protein
MTLRVTAVQPAVVGRALSFAAFLVLRFPATRRVR